jgi:hypothetical protein
MKNIQNTVLIKVSKNIADPTWLRIFSLTDAYVGAKVSAKLRSDLAGLISTNVAGKVKGNIWKSGNFGLSL